MCHLRMVDNQAFTKRRMSSDLIINAPPFLYLRQSNRLAFLFSPPPRFMLRNCPAECQESYRPHQNSIKVLTCSDFSENRCACTAVALCEGVSPPIFDTVRNLLQINACLLQYSHQFFPGRNPYQMRFELPSFANKFMAIDGRFMVKFLRQV